MGIRWRGYGHPELYKMINAGPGAGASDPQTAYWGSLSSDLTEVDQTLNTKLNNMGASWEGQAAESAQSGLTPLAEWASDAETGSTVMQSSAQLQGEYISDARSSMPEPVQVTTPAPSGWQMATAAAGMLTGNPGPAAAVAAQSADHEAQETAQNEAEQKAVQTMQTYQSNSTWNRETLGTFVAPPDVVVATPAPRGGTGSAVQGPGSTTGSEAGGSQGTTASHLTIPTTNGGASSGGQLVPHGGGVSSPAGGQVPVGSGVSTPPATTTPSGLIPPTGGTPPFGGGAPTPGPTTVPPAGGNPGLNNPLLPAFNNTGTPEPPIGGGNGPLGNGANRGPNVGGRPPLNTGGGPIEENASNVARRGLPVRGGLPGGGPGGAFEPEATRGPSQFGRGPGGPGQFGRGVGGAAEYGRGVPGESAVGRGPGAAAAAGGRGAAAAEGSGRGAIGRGAIGRGGVNGPMGAGGRRGEGEDDDERFAPDYLLETEDVFGDDRRVVPGVIGETEPQE
jgi:hypothetical protein